MKTTDEAFIETFHLFDFIQAVLNRSPQPKTLICDVVSSGTVPRRPGHKVGWINLKFLFFHRVLVCKIQSLRTIRFSKIDMPETP